MEDAMTARRQEAVHTRSASSRIWRTCRCARCTTTTGSACSSPSGRTAAGYRRYSAGRPGPAARRSWSTASSASPWSEIAEPARRPGADPTAHLRRQHRLLRERMERLHGAARGRREGDGGTTDGHRADPRGAVRGVRHRQLGGSTPTRPSERWGDTDAYRSRSGGPPAYTKEDWVADQGRGRRRAAGASPRALRGRRAGRRPSGDGPRRGAPAAHHPVVLRLRATRCTAGWPRCTSPTTGSRAHLRRRSRPAWRSTCTTPIHGQRREGRG